MTDGPRRDERSRIAAVVIWSLVAPLIGGVALVLYILLPKIEADDFNRGIPYPVPLACLSIGTFYLIKFWWGIPLSVGLAWAWLASRRSRPSDGK